MERLIISFIDTETAGLPKDMKAPYSDVDNWPRLLSVGLITTSVNVGTNGLIHSSSLISEIELIRAYNNDIINPPESMAINGITPEIQQEKGVGDAHLLRWIYDTMKCSQMVVSHNTEFDSKVIAAEFHRAKMGQQSANWFCTKEDIGDVTGLPATEKQRAYRPNVDYKLLKLDELYQHLFGTPIEDREIHGALKDAKACAQCFFRLNQKGYIKV